MPIKENYFKTILYPVCVDYPHQKRLVLRSDIDISLLQEMRNKYEKQSVISATDVK
jgi:hypothetical protein